MATLRERVESAATETLLEELEDYRGDADLAAVARSVVAAMFDAMAGVRPCARCGKSIGPAKVARGYVLCYSCGRD